MLVISLQVDLFSDAHDPLGARAHEDYTDFLVQGQNEPRTLI